ncbi:MAG TPA: GTP cyclohydrolase II [Gammaproteobacteria bacterium]|nr:GTP cyclohydrolase II [Gammaproteobacteria bacterium]
MFTYLNPTVRQRLIADGKLIRINERGETITPEQPPPEGELAINVLGPIPLPVKLGELEIQARWYATVRSTELAKVEELAAELSRYGGQRLFSMLASSMAVNSVLAIGPGEHSDNPLVRVHSSCLTGDVFGSQRCECGPQFVSALKRIDEDPHGGMLIYMSGHEGRGIGLWAKAATYLLQDAGENTYEANRSLGLPDDSRDFTDAAALLHHFVRGKPFRLLTNNPKKIADLNALGLAHITPVRHVSGVNPWNTRYLAAKRDWGHALSESDLGLPKK